METIDNELLETIDNELKSTSSTHLLSWSWSGIAMMRLQVFQRNFEQKTLDVWKCEECDVEFVGKPNFKKHLNGECLLSLSKNKLELFLTLASIFLH